MARGPVPVAFLTRGQEPLRRRPVACPRGISAASMGRSIPRGGLRWAHALTSDPALSPHHQVVMTDGHYSRPASALRRRVFTLCMGSSTSFAGKSSSSKLPDMTRRISGPRSCTALKPAYTPTNQSDWNTRGRLYNNRLGDLDSNVQVLK